MASKSDMLISVAAAVVSQSVRLSPPLSLLPTLHLSLFVLVVSLSFSFLRTELGTAWALGGALGERDDEKMALASQRASSPAGRPPAVEKFREVARSVQSFDRNVGCPLNGRSSAALYTFCPLGFTSCRLASSFFFAVCESE